MTAFPARGQKAPEYWDTQLKAYIDEADDTKADDSATTAALAAKANTTTVNAALALKADAAATSLAINAKADDSAVVKLTGAQTIAGVKTFSSAPTVPDDAFTQAKVLNLDTDLADKEPLRTAVTQAEAEAGVSATIRGWSALRVKQAVAGYIAANVASIKTTLGVSSVPYLWSSVGSATITTTGTYRIASAQTLAQARMRVASAASGSALTVEVQRQVNSTGSWTTLTTLSITAGSTTENVQTVTTSLAANDLLRLNVTSVGSGTAATGVVVEVYPA
jgi:hypothetical protein